MVKTKPKEDIIETTQKSECKVVNVNGRAELSHGSCSSMQKHKWWCPEHCCGMTISSTGLPWCLFVF